MNSLWLSNNKLINNNFIKEIDTSNTTLLETDVCIVGAGIFGLTCAYYLSNLGYRVTVLEKDKIGTNKTVKNALYLLESGEANSDDYDSYMELTNSNGQLVFEELHVEANEQAIKNIKNIIDKEKIKCDFEYKNSYVYTTKKEDLKFIKKEQKAIENLGFNCEYVTKTGLPFEIEGAICFKNQAQFHPLKYLNGLCHCITKNNNEIYTNSTVFDVQKENDFYITFSNNFNVKSKYVIVATHYPFINFPGFYFAKMYQSTSYLIAVDTKKNII